jgi:hypothetical protein
MPYDEDMPEVFIIFAFLFLVAPIAKAIGRRIERHGLDLPKPAEDQELRRALQLTEQRLADSETRLAALEERVDFYEKLLANPTSSSKSESPKSTS